MIKSVIIEHRDKISNHTRCEYEIKIDPRHLNGTSKLAHGFDKFKIMQLALEYVPYTSSLSADGTMILHSDVSGNLINVYRNITSSAHSTTKLLVIHESDGWNLVYGMDCTCEQFCRVGYAIRGNEDMHMSGTVYISYTIELINSYVHIDLALSSYRVISYVTIIIALIALIYIGNEYR